jgi:hypothetical protein
MEQEGGVFIVVQELEEDAFLGLTIKRSERWSALEAL